MKASIIIWGTGERTSIYLRHQYFSECDIKGFIDSNKYGTKFHGKQVWNPIELPELMKDTDYLVIANYFIGEIFSQCLNLGIDREKIIFTDWIEESFINADKEKILSLEPKLKQDLEINRYKLVEMNEKDETDGKREIGKGKFGHVSYMRDYFRYRSFEYMADLLEEDDVPGALAELGVFRGEFSALINQKFPQRKLYLFDTFEGFDKQEIISESKKGRCDDRFSEFFTYTSVERMINNLPNQEMAIICKGFFPDSVNPDVERERFAFVSIDVDFEDSIYAGLEFFYPRLSDGGVIFLHDYNSAFLGGVKNAVKRYETKLGNKLRKVPFADRAGTLVIIK